MSAPFYHRLVLCVPVMLVSVCHSQAAQEPDNDNPLPMLKELREKYPLRFDVKLRPPVTVEGSKHTLKGLLELLQKATGLKLTVAPNLEKHQPDFGHMQLPKVGSYSVMELIASRELEEGRWVKTVDGYQLTAKKSLVKPPPPPKEKPKLSPLRDDPALQIEVALTGPGLTLAQLMAGAQKATGRRLSVDPKLGEHQPVFQQKLHKGPAWAVMQMMAVKQLTDGRWVKTADGYQLTATESKYAKAQAEKKAFEEAQAKGVKAYADFIKFHPLGLDVKLHARLTVVERRPKLADLLGRLSAATGLNFSLADNLTYHDPDLGHIDLKNMGAYSFMEIIAKSDLGDGRWEKTNDGYRLEGVSRALRPPARPFPWAWAAVVVAITLLAAGAFVIYRRRGKKATTNPNNA